MMPSTGTRVLWPVGRGALGKSGSIIAVILVGLVVAVLFLPQIRNWFLTLRSEEITIDNPRSRGVSGEEATLDLRIYTILGRDGIPAILMPSFVEARQAYTQMVPEERVLGVSINGDHRAYPLNLLSRHEIVNDTVGGKAIAVTW